MTALITGASSGIGADIARILSDKGYDLILVARNKKKMDQLAKELKTNIEIISMDISSTYNCTELYNLVKKKNIDILINNAGFGLFGEFTNTKLDKELDMIELNIKTVHTLTKLFLKDFVKRNRGRILNIASFAGFMPGPYMATYYATKSYVVNLTLAVAEELKQNGSKVHLSLFCPGPVETNFNDVANVKFNIPSLTKEKAAKIAIEGMFQNKKVIIPLNMKLNYALVKVSPINLVLAINSNIQERVDK